MLVESTELIPYALPFKAFSPLVAISPSRDFSTIKNQPSTLEKKRGYFLKIKLNLKKESLTPKKLIVDIPYLMGCSFGSLKDVPLSFDKLKERILRRSFTDLKELNREIDNPSLAFGFQSLFLFNDATLPNNENSSIIVKKNALLDIHSNHFPKNIEMVRSSETIKIKVGRDDVVEEAKKVKWICRLLKKNIRLDVNRSWNKKEYLIFVKNLDDEKKFIEYIEEPLDVSHGLEDLAELYHHSSLPYAIDERFRELYLKNDVHLIETHFDKGLNAIVVKPSLGPSLMEIEPLIEKYRNKVKWVVSSAFETDLGLLALGYFIKKVGLEKQTGGHGLDTHRWIEKPVLKKPLKDLGNVLVFPYKKITSSDVSLSFLS